MVSGRRGTERRILVSPYATGLTAQTRDVSPRQLPTNHDYEASVSSTLEYQTDQPSILPPRPLSLLLQPLAVETRALGASLERGAVTRTLYLGD